MSVVIDKNQSHTERASIDKLHFWDKLRSRVTTWFKLSYMLSMSTKHSRRNSGRKEMFYLTTQSTHFIYGYMASDIWLRPILIVRKETRCRHIGSSFRLTARVLLYAPSHIQDSTYHGLCYTSRGALAGTRTTNFRSNPPSPHLPMRLFQITTPSLSR